MIAPWAQEEMATADLGDERLDDRVVTLLSALGSRPNLSIRAVCKGRAEMEATFEPSEWKAVWVAVHRKKPPRKAPRLAEMVHLIAALGGYVERPNNEPGAQTLWIGLQRTYDLAWAWDTFGPAGKVRVS